MVAGAKDKLRGGRSAARSDGVKGPAWEPTLSVRLHPPEDLLLESFSSYRFLVAGHVEIPGQEDDALFDETLEAMEIMGFNEEERIGM